MPKRGGSKGKKKLTTRDLSRIPLTRDEANKQFKKLGDLNPPIITALLGQVLMENELDDLLRGRFSRNDDDTWNILTDQNAPLGTFYNKTTAAYALGIVDETIKNALNTIGKIRNAFAHSKIELDFSNDVIKSELRSVKLPTKKRSNLYKELSAVRSIADSNPPGPQMAYSVLCVVIGGQLGKKRLARTTAKYKRLTRKHRRMLAANMIGQSIGPQSHFLRGLLESQNGDPTFLNLLSSPPKRDH